MNGIKQFLYGFLGRKVEENFEVYKQNFDVVLTYEDATFNTVKEIVFGETLCSQLDF